MPIMLKIFIPVMFPTCDPDIINSLCAGIGKIENPEIELISGTETVSHASSTSSLESHPGALLCIEMFSMPEDKILQIPSTSQ